jgi:hypothetical protein
MNKIKEEMKKNRCICGYTICHGETFEWDGIHLCSEECRMKEFAKEELWDEIAGNIGFDRKGKALQKTIREFVRTKQEEVITFIGNTNGWEESEDRYRVYFGFKKKYKKRG